MRKRSRRLRRLAVAALVLGALTGLGGLIALTGLGAYSQQETSVAEGERNAAAQEAQSVAAPQDALCRTSSNVAAVLAATGLCDRSRQVLDNPIVAGSSTPLSAAQLDAIVARVLPADNPPSPAPNDDLVSGILSRLAAQPEGQSLDEAATRAVVAGAVGQSDPDPAAVTPETSEGERFTSLRFERDAAGQCQGIVTLTRQDGTTREQATPVGDNACSSPSPDPDPEPPASSTPPAPPATSEQVVPSSEPDPPSGAPGETAPAVPTS